MNPNFKSRRPKFKPKRHSLICFDKKRIFCKQNIRQNSTHLKSKKRISMRIMKRNNKSVKTKLLRSKLLTLLKRTINGCHIRPSNRNSIKNQAQENLRCRSTPTHTNRWGHQSSCPSITYCGAELKDVLECFAYSSIITELYHEQKPEQSYPGLNLKNMELRHFRKQCPNCAHWSYPQLGLLKNARFRLSFIMYVISLHIEIKLPYKRLIRDLIKQFGPIFSLNATSIIDRFLKFEDQLKDMNNQWAAQVKAAKFIGINEIGLFMNGEN